MIRIGVDVGGTNTDAVVMRTEDFLGGAKSPTTKDILSGVENAIKAALDQAKTEPKDVKALINIAKSNGYNPLLIDSVEKVNNKQKDRVKMLNLGHNLLWPALAPNITLCITVACLTKPRF